jgi:hypothetical protein
MQFIIEKLDRKISMTNLIEYMKLHLISLMQDLESLEDQMEKLDMNSKEYLELDFDYNIKSGEITATRHLMSVATDIMNNDLQGKGY